MSCDIGPPTSYSLNTTRSKLLSLFESHDLDKDVQIRINDGLLEMRSEPEDSDKFDRWFFSILQQIGYTNVSRLDFGDTSVIYFGPSVPPLIWREGTLDYEYEK